MQKPMSLEYEPSSEQEDSAVMISQSFNDETTLRTKP